MPRYHRFYFVLHASYSELNLPLWKREGRTLRPYPTPRRLCVIYWLIFSTLLPYRIALPFYLPTRPPFTFTVKERPPGKVIAPRRAADSQVRPRENDGASWLRSHYRWGSVLIVGSPPLMSQLSLVATVPGDLEGYASQLNRRAAPLFRHIPHHGFRRDDLRIEHSV
ncbi:hypothetical protein DFP72DRAFT_205590 [Ephemerocybe angulata]|uniref:Uncharacterized protein n=1 Tax=Ephemerocybe angulata TaxID=980116 RepID=A0A8H6IKF1_9AGAR|nr:hypothetical protein DFP72DRAFT_205590 [Tulosesus angulatus]